MVEQCAEALARGEPSSLATGELTMERIALAARNGDRLAGRILGRSAVLLARVVAGALALLNPDTVVFAGGVAGCLDVIQQVFDDELRRRAPGFSLAGTRILRSAFGDWAGAVGAAAMPLERG
jgi:glucokinase